MATHDITKKKKKKHLLLFKFALISDPSRVFLMKISIIFARK